MPTYKFEKLDIWQLSFRYIDLIYELSDLLPDIEKFNLCEQVRRSAISVNLNIAEGSTTQSDPEQARFIGIALRSYLETVAIQKIIIQRKYLSESHNINKKSINTGHQLFIKCKH